jgi:hypothetical protein
MEYSTSRGIAARHRSATAGGSALRSQADSAVAHELETKALLLQSQLDYIEAPDEMIEAMGQTPE